ncbi:ABC transporter ATP-binding protein [Clostridium oryzae]|uniref:Oligopeptide transport ATP-binding protein OppF n=1 Tax=Clostridium oryzae TaxID=1450648 RepID=A0A1V4IEP9_9CLOT|nr:dipeptide ABC transporter ATP-binding protein [Clostridium oryzae]OPJ58399.1 oligopeptide transport ATP-binding protein OppF [Clostridium oryzae]
MENTLVKVQGLTKHFALDNGAFNSKHEFVHAVDNVSFEVQRKETFALVGESGCGKSTLGRLLIRLINATTGSITFNGNDISKLKGSALRQIRKEMQIIFQDPFSSLNPRMNIRDIIAEPLLTHKIIKKSEKESYIGQLMELVGLRKEYMSRYPHMFSGGQRQRIGIARAIALNPKFIVCDEPVSALDVSIQSQIINLLQDLQEEKDLTYLFISHDLGVVRYISSRVCVMFLGKIMELGPTEELYTHPLHPYTKFLIAAAPIMNPHDRDKEKLILQGDIPSPVNVPSGCRFHFRCPYCKKICTEEEPQLIEKDGRSVACHFPGK